MAGKPHQTSEKALRLGRPDALICSEAGDRGATCGAHRMCMIVAQQKKTHQAVVRLERSMGPIYRAGK
jgi:hypothetical protein